MRANSITLQKIFEQTIRYRIPLFQRPYVWTEEDNWVPIWEDVRTLAERHLREGDAPPHFLGAVVLDQLRGPTGSVESRQVIDGQQRMTTLQVLFAMLRDISRDAGEDRCANRFTKLTENDESFLDEPDDKFKVWPTNLDRENFRRVMQAGSPENLRVAFGVKPRQKRINVRLADAYLYFHEQVRAWLSANGEDPLGDALEATGAERLDALWQILRGHIYIVAMDLEEDDDAQVIFETLNARGTRLLPADLVKNYLFHRAELEDDDIEALYKDYWQRFDSDFWREKIKQGRLLRPRIDIFLQHYLTLKTYNEVNVGHIFNVFRHFAEAGVSAGSPTRVLLKDLTRYGDVFERFYNPPEGTRVERFFQRLAAIDTATVYPLLLEIFRVYDTPETIDTLHGILTDLESLLVRRLICNLTTKNYNRLFLELVKDAEKAGGITPGGLRASLLRLNNESVRWPDDAEFGKAFVSLSLYKILPQAKLSMTLRALDHALETGKSEAVLLPQGLTLEHIMPQRWQDYWPLPALESDDPLAKQHAVEQRELCLHRIGNLTILTKKLNPSVSNNSWTTKRAGILEHSKLNLNRYFQKIETWDEEAIAKRAESLLETAIRVWPYPASEAK